VVLSKYQVCGSEDELNTTTKPPLQSLVFGANSFQTVVRTINHYAKTVNKCMGRYINKYISSASGLTAKQLAMDMEDFLQESGLVVNQCIPIKLWDIEKNKHLKNVPGLTSAAAAGKPLPPISNNGVFGIA